MHKELLLFNAEKALKKNQQESEVMPDRYVVKNFLIWLLAKRLGIKVKTLTAEYLYTLVRDKKVSYESIKEIEPKRF